MLKKCEELKDFKAVPGLFKERLRVIDMLFPDDKQDIDWAAIAKSKTFILGLFPETLGLEMPANLDERIKKIKQRAIGNTDHIPEAELDED